MAPHQTKGAGPIEPLTPDEPPVGPPSGIFSIPTQYVPEQNVRHRLRTINSEDSRIYDESLEDKYRLKGVQLIDNVRRSLSLPVKTFDTAATYYHKFRTRYPSSEYNYEDAALASLFVACKVEDTIKKSKEILCAAHNIRQSHDHKTSDDKVFEQYSKFIIGLERHILETIGFDFRGQYPQKLLVKLVRDIFSREEGKAFLRVAYDMSIDMYSTFAPVKQSTFTMVLAILELTARLTGVGQGRISRLDPRRWHTKRECVLETMLDLLDVYTHFPKSTKLGNEFEMKKLMDIKIELNNTIEKQHYHRFGTFCNKCQQEAPDIHPITPGSATSPATSSTLTGGYAVKNTLKKSEGSIRFVFDPDEARKERDLVGEYFFDEMEEYEVEVEEKIPPEEPRHGPSRTNHGHRNNNRDHGWAPYQGRHGHGHNDRPKGPKGRHYY